MHVPLIKIEVNTDKFNLVLKESNNLSESSILEAILLKQKNAFYKNPFPDLSARKNKLKRLRSLILENMDEICDALDLDFDGRSHNETKTIECFPALLSINYTLKRLKRWMKPQRKRMSIWFQPSNNTLFHQPLGVVGIVVPWNCPLYLTISPMVSALAAGNNIMVKLPELTNAFNSCFTKLIQHYFDETEISIINGDINTGKAFSKLNFDKLLFTGSTKVGKKIMAAAAENLTPVILELGGKSPVIISETFDIKLAAKRVVSGKLCNAGQICVAPDHVYLPNNKFSVFIDTLQFEFNKQYPDWENKDLTSIIDDNHYNRLQTLIIDAKEKGATIKWLATVPENNKHRKLPLVIVYNLTNEMLVTKEEIFGPILPIYRYSNIDTVIQKIKSDEKKPLALYYFGKKNSTNIIKQTLSGGITLNDTHMHVIQDDMPFGGVGTSGMGCYHGIEGFKAFSNAKSIFKQSKIEFTTLLKAPYTPIKEFLINLIIKF